MILTGKTYDRAKFIALIFLPAIGALYFSLAQIWGLPAAEQVVGTITVVDTFLGVILRISSSNYDANTISPTVGSFVIHEEEGVKRWNLVLDQDPEVFETAQEITFKIQR